MAVRAQYRRAWSAGEQVNGYLEEDDVPEDSTTETYAALRLEVDNWRWAGVPIYLRTGKRLARKVTEIAVTLKPVPHLAFQQDGLGGRAAQPDHPHHAAERGRVDLARREDPRQPDADPPGEHGVPLRHRVPVAVARGLRAADHGRHARRRHAVHARRRGRGAVAHLRPDPRGVGVRRPGPLPQYEAGSSGPDEADELLGARGDSWRASSLRRPERRRLARAGHHARGDRGGAARAAQAAPRRERGRRARAGAQPGGDRRPRVARRDPEPARQGGALPRVAHDPVRGRARARDDRRLGHDDRRRRRQARRARASATSRSSWTSGPQHLQRLDTIVDPLVVTDLATLRLVAARAPRGAWTRCSIWRRSSSSTR